MFLSIILKFQVLHINILLEIRKGDRFLWSLVRECGPCTATQVSSAKKHNVIVSTREAFFVRFCEYKIICFSFKDFRQQSRRVSHMSVDEWFSAQKQLLKTLYVFEVLKKEKLWTCIATIFKTFFENKGRRFLFCEVLLNQGHRSRTKDH